MIPDRAVKDDASDSSNDLDNPRNASDVNWLNEKRTGGRKE